MVLSGVCTWRYDTGIVCYLKVGDEGSLVLQVQTALGARGFPVKPDGLFGHQTTKHVRRYQTSQGLYPSGIVEHATAALLFTDGRIEDELVLGTDPAIHSVNALVRGLAGTSLEPLVEDLWAVSQAEKLKAGFLAALALVESQDGQREAFHDRYNIFGFRNFRLEGDHYASPATYESYRDCLEKVASYVVRLFLTPDAPHFMGATIAGFVCYATSERSDSPFGPKWAHLLASSWQSIRNQVSV